MHLRQLCIHLEQDAEHGSAFGMILRPQLAAKPFHDAADVHDATTQKDGPAPVKGQDLGDYNRFLTCACKPARLWMSEQEPRGKAGRHLRSSSGSGAVMGGGGIAWLAIRVAMPSGAVVVAGWPQALGR